MKVTRVGIDLAKDVFQIHGVDSQGKTVLRRKLKSSEMMKFFKEPPTCLIGLEALPVRTTGHACSMSWGTRSSSSLSSS